MNKKNQFVELRSEEVQELLTRAPASIIRWGMTVVALVLCLIFIGSWMIHYPDLVSASFKLTSNNAPKAVFSKTEGRIVKILVSEGSVVESGSAIAYLESTANHDEVLKLQAALHHAWTLINKGQYKALTQSSLAAYHQLGELQSAYQTFIQEYDQLKFYQDDGFYGTKKRLLQQELNDLAALGNNLQNQLVIQERDKRIADEDYSIQSQLAKDNVIAPLELKREESKHISKQLPYQQTESAIITNLMAQRTKQQEILELDKRAIEGRDKFLQSLNTLQSMAEAWRVKYIVSAPTSGKVHFPLMLQENQYIKSNTELLYVSPADTEYVGELNIPQQNFGKVQTGQSVLIKFPAYPYSEFGVLRGTITEISEVSFTEGVFQAKVKLTNGLTTNYGKKLGYKSGMIASAEVITDDSRLLQKIFYQLRKAVDGRG